MEDGGACAAAAACPRLQEPRRKVRRLPVSAPAEKPFRSKLSADITGANAIATVIAQWPAWPGPLRVSHRLGFR